MKKKYSRILDALLIAFLIVSVSFTVFKLITTRANSEKLHQPATVEEFLGSTLDVTLSVAKLSGDAEAIKIAKFLKSHLVVGLVTSADKKSMNVTIAAVKKDSQIIALVPNDLIKLMPNNNKHGLKYSEMSAWYDIKRKTIFVIAIPGITTTDMAIALLHEGVHALQGRSGKVTNGIEREIPAYDLQFRVLEGLGGKDYIAARDKAQADFLEGKTNDVAGLTYDPCLDEILGKTTSENCRLKRRCDLGMAAIWHAAEQMGGKNERLTKVEMIKEIYRL